VFRSWHELAGVLGFELVHICDAHFHESIPHVRFSESIDDTTDVLITDSWPADFDNTAWTLNSNHLKALGDPKLLPTPPFSIGREIAFDPLQYQGFMGYEQKIDLLLVQKAILSYLMAH
jgi:ornithine carbamoyltransferase